MSFRSEAGPVAGLQPSPPALESPGIALVRCWFTACLTAGAILLMAFHSLAVEERSATPILRIAADPNNLPFSNERLEGFENKIAELIARELNAGIEYTWHPQRRGFFRKTIKEGNCNLVLGVPAGFDMVLTTKPYYQSTYVFIHREADQLNVTSFDDPRLHDWTIGVQIIGDDFMNTPPAHALSARGIIRNVRGYTVYGNYAEESPPSRIIQAVARGEIDLAVAWGPLAGYFATRQSIPLTIVPVPPEKHRAVLPFIYSISMGVRRGHDALRQQLNQIIDRKQKEIDRILDDYGIPRVANEGQ